MESYVLIVIEMWLITIVPTFTGILIITQKDSFSSIMRNLLKVSKPSSRLTSLKGKKLNFLEKLDMQSGEVLSS